MEVLLLQFGDSFLRCIRPRRTWIEADELLPSRDLCLLAWFQSKIHRSFELLCFLYRNNAKIFDLARFDAESIIFNTFRRKAVRLPNLLVILFPSQLDCNQLTFSRGYIPEDNQVSHSAPMRICPCATYDTTDWLLRRLYAQHTLPCGLALNDNDRGCRSVASRGGCFNLIYGCATTQEKAGR